MNIPKWLRSILYWLNGGDPKSHDEPDTAPPNKSALADEIDMALVTFHGPNIRDWKIAAPLDASIKGGQIMLLTELLKGRAATGDNGTTGNAWACAKGSDGKWRAYSYEWISYDRKSRDLWKAFDRGHGAPSVVDAGTDDPQRGTEFYVAVATVSRGNYKGNGNERTPFKKVVVP